jgi:hypothetical protein
VKTSLEKFEQQITGLEKARIDAYATLTEQVRSLAGRRTSCAWRPATWSRPCARRRRAAAGANCN